MAESRTPEEMSELRFAKYHGTGNDFVMLEDLEGEVSLSGELVAALCDRSFGVGADGLIRVGGPALAKQLGMPDAPGADFTMDYYNADGAAAEMCGNGVRCLAKLVHDRELTDKRVLTVATRGGPKRVWIDVANGEVASVTVDMGPPAFERENIPMAGPPGERFLAEPFEWEGASYKASALSMGNPHLVLFVDQDPDSVDVERVGPAIEHHELFPNRTNVEFLAPAGEGVKVRVWERGVRETMACGTGACASLVAAHLAGLTARRAEVLFPGGALDVEWREDGSVYLAGPAARVFEGSLDPAELLRSRRPD